MSGTAYSQVPQIERDALIALYNSTDGANWKDNTGWMGAAGTECTWFGVTCSNNSVSRLSFWQNQLTGTIPSELGNLTNLTYLHFGANSLSGSIPKELGNLTKLTGIYLFSNALTGAIPQEWSDITNVNYGGNLFAEPGCTISTTERDALNAALPDSFDYVICYEGTSYTASFSFVSNRGPNFEVWKQKDDGTFDVLEVPIIRTYIGTVQGVPGATVSAVRFDSGNVFYRAVFEDGREWVNTGGQTDLLCDKGANNICKVPELKFPEFVVGEGGAGSMIYGVEVGVDMPFHQYDGVQANDIVAALSII